MGSPFLTTEVADLAFWLGAITTGGDLGESKEFFEPLLYFKYGGKRGDNVVVRIGFGLEFIPPWAGRDEVDALDHCWDFELTASELAQASKDLKAQGELFPFRPQKPDKVKRRP